MPRPTVAQLVYGTCTVIFSTLAMLSLSQARSGPAIAVIAVAGLALGLLVAMTVPLPKQRTSVQVQPAPEERVPASISRPAATEPVRERAAS
ncbi:hypothetical protein [Streptomyces bullii]|uniref:Secreted protein n=1 Tax=Streptomyces bullii TaxID=349910 RepID=A0ABW0ULW6_9ACTN